MGSWDSARFREVLRLIKDRTGLSQEQLANLAGRHRTQFNRWTRAENKPGYDAVARLASEIIASHPEAADLAKELLTSAGYGVSSLEATRASEPETPSPPQSSAHSPPAADAPAQEPRTEQNVSRAQAEQIAGALEQLLATVMSRIGVLETEVAELRRENAQLRADLSAIQSQLRHKSAKSA
jgi:transcriptional regulator with XRE-family HTH domain